MPHQLTSGFAQPTHGFYRLEIHGDFIRIFVAESINAALIREYQQVMNQAIGRLTQHPWGVHLVVQEDGLMTEEAARLLVTITQAHSPRGRRCTAIELRNPSARALQQRVWLEIYQQAGLRCATFEDEQSAVTWIRQQLAEEAKVARDAG